MNKFTKSLIDNSVSACHTLNSIETIGFNAQHQSKLDVVGIWIENNLKIKDGEVKKDIVTWMDMFVRDGSKVISIPFALAQSLIESDLPEDNKWNFETFGFASIIEITQNNYIITKISPDENKQYVKSMGAAEIALNDKKLFENNDAEKLVTRISYIFRNRPNGLIIEENKPNLATAKKAARKAGKKIPEAVPGTLYIIKEDAALQAKYIKQLQEKAEKKVVNNPEKLKRNFRSFRRGHFRNQPIGARSEKKHELRWIMGHWMGSMDLPMKIQANKIRLADMPVETVKKIFNNSKDSIKCI